MLKYVIPGHPEYQYYGYANVAENMSLMLFVVVLWITHSESGSTSTISRFKITFLLELVYCSLTLENPCMGLNVSTVSYGSLRHPPKPDLQLALWIKISYLGIK